MDKSITPNVERLFERNNDRYALFIEKFEVICRLGYAFSKQLLVIITFRRHKPVGYINHTACHR